MVTSWHIQKLRTHRGSVRVASDAANHNRVHLSLRCKLDLRADTLQEPPQPLRPGIAILTELLRACQEQKNSSGQSEVLPKGALHETVTDNNANPKP